MTGSPANVATGIAGIQLTSPGRLIYPSLEFTKADLAKYFEEIAPRMLRHVAGRPLTLVRCAQGVDRPDALRTQCKFIPHEAGFHRWAAPMLERVQITEQKKVGEYLVARDAAGLVSLAQGGMVEVHVWNATAPNIQFPDRFVLDLDPGPGVAWDAIRQAATRVRKRLLDVGLESWPMLTGGKGIHVVVPIEPDVEWAGVYRASQAIAESFARDVPDLFTVHFEKARRHGKILLDYKRNYRGAIAVAAYSPRAVPSGAIATPVSWRSLAKAPSPSMFTVCDGAKLARARVDPWADYWTCKQSLRALFG